jgi:hypothetical protein
MWVQSANRVGVGFPKNDLPARGQDPGLELLPYMNPRFADWTYTNVVSPMTGGTSGSRPIGLATLLDPI